MHIDSASLLINVALITVGVLAVGFMVWFSVALTLEKNGKHVRCRMEFQIDGLSTDATDRQPLRAVSVPRPLLPDIDSASPELGLSGRLVTHRAVRAVALTSRRRPADEFRQAGPLMR